MPNIYLHYEKNSKIRNIYFLIKSHRANLDNMPIPITKQHSS